MQTLQQIPLIARQLTQTYFAEAEISRWNHSIFVTEPIDRHRMSSNGVTRVGVDFTATSENKDIVYVVPYMCLLNTATARVYVYVRCEHRIVNGREILCDDLKVGLHMFPHPFPSKIRERFVCRSLGQMTRLGGGA